MPEPESRYGLSLARNDAYATIARSKFLACTFVSPSKIFANPFDSRLFRSVRFRGRTGATSTPGTRYPRRSPTFPISPPVSTPLQVLLRKPSGSKRSTGPISGSSSHRTPDSSPIPTASSFDWLSFTCTGCPARNPLRPARLSFRKPWNCLDHSQRRRTRQTKTECFKGLSTTFSGLVIQRLADMHWWILCA